jgi:hypothetical protein
MLVRWFVCAFFTPAFHPAVRCSLVRHQADSWKRDQKSRQRLPIPPFTSVTLLAFAGCLMHFAHGLLSAPTVKRAAYGRVTDSGSKKKL